MEDASLPPQLREKCRNATTVAAHHISLENRARQCMNNLPNSLRTEIQLFMHRKVIRDINFLRTIVDVHPLFVAKCASMMQIPMKVRLGELIVQEGSSSSDMYFLVKGTVIAVRQGFPIMEVRGCEERSNDTSLLPNYTPLTTRTNDPPFYCDSLRSS